MKFFYLHYMKDTGTHYFAKHCSDWNGKKEINYVFTYEYNIFPLFCKMGVMFVHFKKVL
jgi:hypothetical protein